MNFLLSIDKRIILLISITFILFFTVFIFSKYYAEIGKDIEVTKPEISKIDITEPKFAINGPSQKIFVTAKEGNFVDKNKIMLKKDVTFKSNDFSIESDYVIFDRLKQEAYSDYKAIFKSKNAIISSDGFNIYDKGDTIKFYGNSKILLK